MNRVPLSRTIVFAVLGLLIGGALGEIMGWLLLELGTWAGTLPENNLPYNLLIQAFTPSFGFDGPQGAILDLYLIKIKCGIEFHLNVMSIVGLFVSFYIERWSRAH